MRLRAGLDQESRPIFPLQTLKSGFLIGRRIEANPDEFRLGVKAITKYWYSIHKIFIFYSQDMGSYTLWHGPKACKLDLAKGGLLWGCWGHLGAMSEY
jgi:hypothetical protein